MSQTPTTQTSDEATAEGRPATGVSWRATSAQSGSLTVSRADGKGANYWIKYPRTQNDEAGRRAAQKALETWLNAYMGA